MKVKNMILYASIIFTCFGCDKFLEEDPRSLISPDTFFSSETDARQAVNGIYAILKNNSIYGQEGLDHYYDYGADICEPNRSISFVEPIGNYSMNESLADKSVQRMGVADTWKDLYRVINNVNTTIKEVSGNNAISSTAQTEIIAEVTFIRALCYWHITNLWGDAPYYIESLTLDEISVLGRTDKATIIAGVLIDLKFAEDNMVKTLSENQRGRATKWAAAIVTAKVYMQQQQWGPALAKCIEIIGQSGSQILPTYAEVFDPFNEYNAEIIWSLDFAKDIRGQFQEGGAAADGTLRSSFGNGMWRPSMFNPRLRDEPKNSSDRGPLGAALTARGEYFNGTGIQIATKGFAKKFPLNDLRRPLNVLESYLGFDLNFPYMPKFMNLHIETSPRFNHGDNRLVFRLADVVLMAAECENELNGPGGAYQYIHQIRERAYATQAEWELTGLSQQQFREAIYDERKWELAGEAHRRIDLIRWGILLEVVQKAEYRTWTTAPTNIKPHHVLLPIPLSQLELNPALLESDPTNNGYR